MLLNGVGTRAGRNRTRPLSTKDSYADLMVMPPSGLLRICGRYPNLIYAKAGKAEVLTESQKPNSVKHESRGPFVALTLDI
ncbi:hypothetical protein, partial [Neorhizobium galegae]